MLNDLKETISLDTIVRNTNKNFRIKQAKKNKHNDISTYRKQRKLFSSQEYSKNISKIKEKYISEKKLILENYHDTIKIINEDKIIMSLNLTGFYSKSSKKYIPISLENPTVTTTSTVFEKSFPLIKRIGLKNFFSFKNLSMKINKIHSQDLLKKTLSMVNLSYNEELKYKNSLIHIRF